MRNDRAHRYGRIAGASGALAGAAVVGLLLGGTVVTREMWLQTLCALGAAAVAVWYLGRLAGVATERWGLLAVPWAGPLTGIGVLFAGGVGIAIGNLPSLARALSEGTPGAVHAWIVKPILGSLFWGALPAAVIGLIAGLILSGALNAARNRDWERERATPERRP